MYSVIVVPTAAEAEPPTAPASLQIRCATSAVVGLQWTASKDVVGLAGYRILRDGMIIGTTTRISFSDTSAGSSAAHTYIVAAFDAAGNTAASAAVIATPSPASRQGDAPICPSQAVGPMTWNWSQGYTQANGSDLWPVTWGLDGNVYALFGDGGGFGGGDRRGRASFGIAMITGAPPPSPSSTRNVYGGYLSNHSSRIGGKASSIITIGTDFYAIAGIFRSTDTRADYPSQPSSSPNHVEVAYSRGNA